MPLYSYRCTGCGVEFDDQRPIEDRKTAVCPTACGGVGEQFITPVAHRLVGNGWAKDGYGRPATGADYRSGRLKPKDLQDIPVVGPDGKLRDKTGAVIAG